MMVEMKWRMMVWHMNDGVDRSEYHILKIITSEIYQIGLGRAKKMSMDTEKNIDFFYAIKSKKYNGDLRYFL